MAEKRKPSWGLWIAAVLTLLPVMYILSFGPACWCFAKPLPRRTLYGRSGRVYTILAGGGDSVPHVSRVYWPLGWLVSNGPEPLSQAVIWYATVGSRDFIVVLPTEPSGKEWFQVWTRF